ncbi:3-dehydroquinate synthase [Cellvibrio sp. PSBB006]|uniref:3-dehydroquinate synthase n=1 Tax=Cellvibrio sp. PSBB006 TaxID=1987723 RepID=UPI000B3B716E|nr:3-dehydroquinate synthase [Cellvibrio sp. PSBB006]ARU28225.1 3-dehydroquinate synthase [Cellvibrio sp. PSBB006]
MHLINQQFSVTYEFSVCFTRDTFAPENMALHDLISAAGATTHKVQPVIDSQVLADHPELIDAIALYGDIHGDTIAFEEPFIVRGGEICKNDPAEVEEFLRLTQERKICRHSFVLVIGGGSVIDAMGYAATIAHRGIRLIRMPTTVLGQNDAGVGVKNAINFRNRKNYVGTFAPPYAVLNDFDFLSSLAPRDQRAGIAEAVKVSLIRDGEFFAWLESHCEQLARFEDEAVEHMIIRCAELHVRHIGTGGDPFERGSARPLDFGHWSAHRLEEISHTQFPQHELRHGEAVAIGIALDSHYARQMGFIDEETLMRIINTLHGIGFSLYHPALEQLNIPQALAGFREHLGGALCITMLTGAGSAKEVSEIDEAVMEQCVQRLRDYQ